MTWLLWLKGNWKALAGGLLIVAACLYLSGLHLRLGIAQGKAAKAEGEVVKLKGELSQWRSSFADLSATAGECSDSVDAFHAKAEQARTSAAQALAKAEARASGLQAAINAAKARESGPARSCEQAVADAKNDLRGIQ